MFVRYVSFAGVALSLMQHKILYTQAFLRDEEELENNDDIPYAGYVGFTNVATMPYRASDMTATLFYANETGGDHDAIYLVGGCISDQVCNSNGCSCLNYTDGCIYYKPALDTWHTCANAPRQRYTLSPSRLDFLLH